jgi:hypothetical protein
MARCKAATGQGGSDQIARSRDSQNRHEAAFAAKEALSREQSWNE